MTQREEEEARGASCSLIHEKNTHNFVSFRSGNTDNDKNRSRLFQPPPSLLFPRSKSLAHQPLKIGSLVTRLGSSPEMDTTRIVDAAAFLEREKQGASLPSPPRLPFSNSLTD